VSKAGRPGSQGEVAELPAEAVDGTDGIVEEDNPIPFWFNATFVATIVFAIVYVAYYTAIGWSSKGQYEAEMAEAKAVASTHVVAVPERNPYHGNAPAIAEGKEVFTQICVACHKPDASGLVGPSLVDPYWKYGDTDHDLYETVMNGRPGGMPAWGPQLGSEKVWKVLAYVETLPRSDKPGLGAPGGAPTPGAVPAPPQPPGGS
jgi:cytochrome c oxidase cbb3-type subunit 3